MWIKCLVRKEVEMRRESNGWRNFWMGSLIGLAGIALACGGSNKPVKSPISQTSPKTSLPLPSNKSVNPKSVDPLDQWYAANNVESGNVKQIGDIEVVMGCKYSVIYVSQNAEDIVHSNSPSYGIFFPVAYRTQDGALTSPSAGFIPINGTPVEIKFQSSDDLIAEVYNDGSIKFKNEGDVSITVVIANESISAQVKVIKFPLKSGSATNEASNAADVVRTLGIPDEKKERFFSWPNSEEVDGIYYIPSVDGGISTEHWKYKKFPGAVIAIVGGRVWSIGTSQNVLK